jgi:hypothetical protein
VAAIAAIHDAGSAEAQTAGVLFERLVDRLFHRALQFVLGGVLFGIAFFPARGHGNALEIATAVSLLALAASALHWRRPLLEVLRGGRPACCCCSQSRQFSR